MRVLVVEDEVLLALEVQDMLQRLGQEVVGPVGNLREALKLAETEQLDAALLDVNLGTENSLKVAETLAERGIPFVFVTGYEHKTLPGSLNTAPRLTKPLDERRLERALHALASETS
jgi:two-component SAPR family response regulator